MRYSKPIKLWRQILSIIPIVAIFTLIDIEKLRIGLSVMVAISASSALFSWLGFPPYVNLIVYLIVWPTLIGKWCSSWNKQFEKIE